MKTFDFYDVRGVLTPGTIVLMGLALLYPAVQALLNLKGFDLGELGLFVILAYVVGQLIQAVANVLESAYWWLWGGKPTDWVRSRKHAALDPEQEASLAAAVQSRLGRSMPLMLGRDTKVTKVAWYGITRQVYAAVALAGQAGRIDIFNAEYGLNRGVATALLVLAALTVASNPAAIGDRLPIIGALLAGVALAGIRMHRFGVHYATELFAQFLQLRTAPNQPISQTVTTASAEV